MLKTSRLSSVTPAILLALVIFASTLSAAEWKEKVLYSFQGGANDGSAPAGGVVFDSKGNLYGATTYGGLTECAIGGECGTVFQLSPPVHKGDPWNETVIYQFRGQGVNDGGVPGGGLIIDAAGNLYGVTAYGGSGDCVLLGLRAGCGTVYELSPPKEKGGTWKETLLYGFPTAQQGYVPNGDLVFDSSGNLYGATIFGGGKGTTCDKFYGGQCGTVFELMPPKTKGGKWTEKVLHAFASGTDGANPGGGLVLDSKGAVYGTTPMGGNQLCNFGNGEIGCGIVFELAPPTKKGGVWTEKFLHRFADGNDGAGPATGMVFDADGSLFGAAGGGAKGGGVIFRLAAGSDGRWKKTAVYEFSSNTYGYGPAVSFFDSSGNLCGTTYSVPDSYSGSVFRLMPPTQKSKPWAMSFLYEFTGPPDGIGPSPYLVRDKSGDFYGATQYGGSGTCGSGGCGTVFELRP